MKSASSNYRLDANYIPEKNSNKTAVLLHGFGNNKDIMAPYAAMFHQLGYNVLMKNARKSPYFNAGMDRAKLT